MPFDPFSALGGVLGAVGKEIWGCISPEIKSICKFRSNLQSLGTEMENLTNLENTVTQHVQAAQASGRAPEPAATVWLQEVEKIKNKVNSTQAIVEGNRSKCHPTCCLRCTVGVQVGKNLLEVKRLLQTGNVPSIRPVENYQVRRVHHIPGPSIVEESTASKNLMEVLSLLDDDRARRIGVWGMGGIGKTTLAKNLNNKLETETATLTQPFKIVIWAIVSKEFNLKTLQAQLLQSLKLPVNSGENEANTASRIHQRLQQEERFLLILDDVWEWIDLDSLGVPDPTLHKGYKIILTSRFLSVCLSMKTYRPVKVDLLNEEESWQLFKENAGDAATLEHIEPIARQVKEECGRLPLAIKIVGASMWGKTTYDEWNGALIALQRSVPPVPWIGEKVYVPLRWSYDSLSFQGMDIKSCFLYCSLYPEDFSIEVRELVQCWFAEDLVKLQTYEASINCGIALIQHLKDSCLLEDGMFKDTVKMHDVVRDVAIWIASSSSEDKRKSFVRSGIGLNQIPKDLFSERESLSRISFMENRITSLPDRSMQCPRVSSLLLQGNVHLHTVPEEFLRGFPSLKVLNLSETSIDKLSFSLLQLHELQGLFLRRCQNLKELLPPSQVSDCSQTDIEALQEGMKISRLRLLDLSHTHRLRYIPTGIFFQLSHLEMINMTDSLYKWGARGDTEEGQASLDELSRLEGLRVLFIHLKVSSLVLEDLSWIERLTSFHFVIGEANAGLLEQPKNGEKRVTICGGSISDHQEWVKWLLRYASHLLLDRCWGLQHLSTKLANGHNFSGLTSLTITGCYFPPARESGSGFDPFPNLEELILQNARGLNSISQLAHHLALRLSKLKTIRVSDCDLFQYLFPYGGFISSLENLQEVAISSCVEFAALFVRTPRQTSRIDFSVPELRIMKFKNLPKLIALFGGDTLWEHLEQLEVIQCNEFKELPFRTTNSIKEIRGETQWWNDLEWNDEGTKNSLRHRFISLVTEGAGF